MAGFDMRYLTVVALLSLVPVAYYFLGTGRNVIVLSLVNVCIIAAALYVMLGPSDHSAVTG